MRRSLWVIDELTSGKWVPCFIFTFRKDADRRLRTLRGNGGEWRLVKYVPEDSRRG